jgi:LmbE family N-acetylglucosaminyl deacetylase
MKKRLLAVFAHPDDEAFGPGGTLAKYAQEGVEIHLLSATRGEAGINTDGKKINLGRVREKELLKSAEILGIKKVEFLNYIDGTLCNAIYHELAGKIIKKINEFRPQVIITVERRGVSGHLDHIAVSMITTYAFLKTSEPVKLYYQCLPKGMRDKMMDDYFVYFPEGYGEDEITTKIDIDCCWETKVAAMKAHGSQIKDVKNILSRWKKYPKIDNFILQFHRGIKVKFPEEDLFSGLY